MFHQDLVPRGSDLGSRCGCFTYIRHEKISKGCFQQQSSEMRDKRTTRRTATEHQRIDFRSVKNVRLLWNRSVQGKSAGCRGRTHSGAALYTGDVRVPCATRDSSGKNYARRTRLPGRHGFGGSSVEAGYDPVRNVRSLLFQSSIRALDH
jgi:hypothetical protein